VYDSQRNSVVYHESHDEAGNAQGSARTMVAAVAGAVLTGRTRDYAEARSRVVFAVSLFSAGTPMFFMGEEIGATLPYRFDDFGSHREDIVAARTGLGANLFRFYQDAIAQSRHHPASRSHAIDILHVNDDGRVLSFLRRSGTDQLLVVVSLSNHPYSAGYVIQSSPDRLENGSWLEILNSDAARYGGANLGNGGSVIAAANGRFEALLPANGVLIFAKSAPP
jgi:1,4-alpha-glucan branching enzyme